MGSKKAFSKYKPPVKQPRASLYNTEAIEKVLNHHPVWQLKILDMNHAEWGWKNLENHTLAEVLEKLKNYETMTWNEIKIDKKRNHMISKNDLVAEAQNRLKSLGLDDIDELFRLRLNGKQRVWGILDRYIFKILWWDPEHTVCPSIKKNT